LNDAQHDVEARANSFNCAAVVALPSKKKKLNTRENDLLFTGVAATTDVDVAAAFTGGVSLSSSDEIVITAHSNNASIVYLSDIYIFLAYALMKFIKEFIKIKKKRNAPCSHVLLYVFTNSCAITIANLHRLCDVAAASVQFM